MSYNCRLALEKVCHLLEIDSDRILCLESKKIPNEKTIRKLAYAYENDVLYAFSIPAYYNRGTRTYLSAKYRVMRGIDVWLRYGLTYYDNVDVIIILAWRYANQIKTKHSEYKGRFVVPMNIEN